MKNKIINTVFVTLIGIAASMSCVAAVQAVNPQTQAKQMLGLFDGNNQFLGNVVSVVHDSDIIWWKTYLPSENYIIDFREVGVPTLEMNINYSQLYYTSPDCSGAPLYAGSLFGPGHPQYLLTDGNASIFLVSTSTDIVSRDYSSFGTTGFCSAGTGVTTGYLLERRQNPFTTLVSPLSIKQL